MDRLVVFARWRHCAQAFNNGFLDNKSLFHKRHHDRFSRFAHGRDQHTHHDRLYNEENGKRLLIQACNI